MLYILSMRYKVTMKPKVIKGLHQLPDAVSERLAELLEDIAESGPVQPRWRNYSMIGKNEYHCHLGYKWVACWRLKDDMVTVEVFYAGSRESAPYERVHH